MKKKDIKSESKEISFDSVELKKQDAIADDYKKVVTFVIILVIMALLFGGLYYFNAKFVTKDEFQNKEDETTTTVKLDTSLILADDIFNIKDDNYLVMLYDASDETSAFLYENAVTGYKGDLSVYKVDLSSAMNKSHYNKDGVENTNPNNANELSVTRNTLIEIKKGKVVNYITDRDSIIKKLSK